MCNKRKGIDFILQRENPSLQTQRQRSENVAQWSERLVWSRGLAISTLDLSQTFRGAVVAP